MMMWAPWRLMQNPTFSKAETALRWLIPAIFGIVFYGWRVVCVKVYTSDFLCHCNLYNSAVFLPGKFLGHLDIFADSNTNIGQRFLFGLTFRPAAGEAGARDTETFVGVVKDDPISSHESYGTPLLNR